MFKELFEAKASLKDAMKIFKKEGEVHITIGKTDTWANIDSIEDGIGYGIDQFDKDIEIDFKKDKFQIVESSQELKTAIMAYAKELDKLSLSDDEWDKRYATELKRLRTKHKK